MTQHFAVGLPGAEEGEVQFMHALGDAQHEIGRRNVTVEPDHLLQARFGTGGDLHVGHGDLDLDHAHGVAVLEEGEVNFAEAQVAARAEVEGDFAIAIVGQKHDPIIIAQQVELERSDVDDHGLIGGETQLADILCPGMSFPRQSHHRREALRLHPDLARTGDVGVAHGGACLGERRGFLCHFRHHLCHLRHLRHLRLGHGRGRDRGGLARRQPSLVHHRQFDVAEHHSAAGKQDLLAVGGDVTAQPGQCLVQARVGCRHVEEEQFQACGDGCARGVIVSRVQVGQERFQARGEGGPILA